MIIWVQQKSNVLTYGTKVNIHYHNIKKGEQMIFVKYPELQGWFKEGLFQKRQICGEKWTVGMQMWYVNKLREKYFANGGVGCIWNVGNVGRGGGDVPYIEKCGWVKAKIRTGFDYVDNKDMRMPMMAMLLTDLQPLPKAHEISDACSMAWEQFKYEFAKGLFEMYQKKVGIYV